MSSRAKKRRVRDRRAKLREAKKLVALAVQMTSQKAAPDPEKSGGPGDVQASAPSRSELVHDGTIVRRPHLYGFDQKKREALGIRNLTTALSPSSGERAMLAASRNCLTMESHEQALQAREEQAGRKAGEQQPGVVVNVNQVAVGVPDLDGLYQRVVASRQRPLPGPVGPDGDPQSLDPPPANGQTG